MSSLLAVLPCCCEEPGPELPEYYRFQACPDGSCCPLECDEAPDVYWCPSYAIAQGWQPPISPDPSVCWMMKYNCCTYILTNVIPNAGSCPPTSPPGLFNVGTAIGVKNIDPMTEDCCDSQNVDLPAGCLMNLAYPVGSAYELTPGACYKYVVKEYTLTDQWGTVPSKPVTLQCDLTYCYETFGAGPTERCNNCPPKYYYQRTVTHTQQHGSCIPVDGGLGNCENQRTVVKNEYLDCGECNPCGVCCPGGTDPCDGFGGPGDPSYDDFCEDPQNWYSIKTCYSVNNCTDLLANQEWFEQDVLTVTYDFCVVPFDPNDPGTLAALTAQFSGGNLVVPWNGNTAFGNNDLGWVLKLCPTGIFSCPCVYILSGDANDIADAINALAINAPYLSASADPIWGSHFWFGIRQTCTPCPGDPPGTRPPFQPPDQSDELVFDRIELVGSTKFKAIFKGRSKKKYLCMAMKLESPWSVEGVTNTCITATGNAGTGFALDCLSPAEYSYGLRYSVRQIEQDVSFETICTSANPGGESVIDCDAVVGYPLYDLYVAGNLTQFGWTSLCGGGMGLFPLPSYFCRAYPYIYEVPPCCPYLLTDPGLCPAWEAMNPTPLPCIDRCFQDSGAYCESQATIMTVTT